MFLGSIKLTEHENSLLKNSILRGKPVSHEEWKEVSVYQKQLFESLAKRNAIPKHRIEWFVNAEYNVGTKKSRKDVYVSNGCVASEIPMHPHFWDDLRYFVLGADLPESVVFEFCECWKSLGQLSSGDVLSLTKHARETTRRFGLRSRDAEEIFKLALDAGLSLQNAFALRKAAMTAAKKS